MQRSIVPCQHSKSRLVFVGWQGIFLLFFAINTAVLTAPCLADQMQPQDQAALTKVLSDTQFTPRYRNPSWTEQLKSVALRWAYAKWVQIKRSLESYFENNPLQIQLPEFIKNIIKFIAGLIGILLDLGVWLALLLLASIIIVLAYRYGSVLLNYIPALKGRSDLKPEQTSAQVTPTLQELVSTGRWLECLQRIRLLIRNRIEHTCALPCTLTDRELLKQLPAQFSERSTFATVTHLFEEVAYYNQPPIPEQIRALVHSVTALLEPTRA